MIDFEGWVYEKDRTAEKIIFLMGTDVNSISHCRSIEYIPMFQNFMHSRVHEF